jgi:hypothetical protein
MIPICNLVVRVHMATAAECRKRGDHAAAAAHLAEAARLARDPKPRHPTPRQPADKMELPDHG